MATAFKARRSPAESRKATQPNRTPSNQWLPPKMRLREAYPSSHPMIGMVVVSRVTSMTAFADVRLCWDRAGWARLWH